MDVHCTWGAPRRPSSRRGETARPGHRRHRRHRRSGSPGPHQTTPTRPGECRRPGRSSHGQPRLKHTYSAQLKSTD